MTVRPVYGWRKTGDFTEWIMKINWSTGNRRKVLIEKIDYDFWLWRNRFDFFFNSSPTVVLRDFRTWRCILRNRLFCTISTVTESWRLLCVLRQNNGKTSPRPVLTNFTQRRRQRRWQSNAILSPPPRIITVYRAKILETREIAGGENNIVVAVIGLLRPAIENIQRGITILIVSKNLYYCNTASRANDVFERFRF